MSIVSYVYTSSRASILGRHTVSDSSLSVYRVHRYCRFKVLIWWERKIQRVVVMADNTDAAAAVVDVQASVELDLYTTKRVEKQEQEETPAEYILLSEQPPREG